MTVAEKNIIIEMHSNEMQSLRFWIEQEANATSSKAKQEAAEHSMASSTRACTIERVMDKLGIDYTM